MATIVKACIATLKQPKDKDQFTQLLREAAEREGLQLLAIKACLGFGCYNIGIKVEGEDPKIIDFLNGVTMALFPSRWSTVSEDFEGFVYEDL